MHPEFSLLSGGEENDWFSQALKGARSWNCTRGPSAVGPRLASHLYFPHRNRFLHARSDVIVGHHPCARIVKSVRRQGLHGRDVAPRKFET